MGRVIRGGQEHVYKVPRCGGTLLSRLHVLTSASCVSGAGAEAAEHLTVLLGGHQVRARGCTAATH